MRTLIAIGSSAVALAFATTAAAVETPKPASPQASTKPPQTGQAPSRAPARAAGGYGQPSNYRSPALGQGYGAQSRHMADCLATYPGYDPASDRIVVRPGVTRRCEL